MSDFVSASWLYRMQLNHNIDIGEPSNGDIEFHDYMAPDLAKKLMECPNCLDVCIPPVYVCKTGHNICQKCHKIGTKCVICPEKYLGGRNLFYEDFFENSTFACRLASEGCKKTMLGKDLKTHHENCDFRPVSCYYCSLIFDGELCEQSYSKFVEHCRKSHITLFSDLGLPGKVATIKSNWNWFQYDQDLATYTLPAFMFKGYTFFRIVQAFQENRMIGMFLWIVGNEAEAKKFRTKISVGRQVMNLTKPTLTWEGPVHSIRNPAKDIFESGNCLNTSVASFWQLGKKLEPFGSSDDFTNEVLFEILDITERW